MKNKLIYAVLSAVIIINSLFSITSLSFDKPSDPPPELISSYAILRDMNSGRVLYEKNADARAYPASTTKIMTAILALENCALDETCEASYDAVMTLGPGAANMGVSEGEILTVEQLLYGCLIYSANECCNILAEHISGSVEAFSDKMNEKAKEIGMENTHFVNANGLHDEDHYTTARDLSTLALYAMQNEKFREIVSKHYQQIDPTNKFDDSRYLTTTNNLINPQSSYYYKWATGIKTGYTEAAGNCLVSSAGKDGKNLLCVTLKADYQSDGIYSFIDSKRLLQYGFENYSLVKIPDNDDPIAEVNVEYGRKFNYVSAVGKENIDVLLPKTYDSDKINYSISLNSDSVEAPVKKGDVLGSVSYYYDNEFVGSCDLVAFSDVDRNILTFIIGKFFFIITYPIRFVFSRWYLGWPVGIILFLFISLRIVRAVNISRRKKKRRADASRRREQQRRGGR